MSVCFNFTIKSLEELEPVPGKRPLYHDQKVRGLCVMVNPSGSKVFYVYGRIANGNPIKYKIGTFPNYSIENARKEAKEILAQMAHGENPHEQRVVERRVSTLDNFFSVYMEQHAKLHKKSHWFDQEQYDRHIKPKLGNYKLTDINDTLLRNFHQKLGATSGHTSSNRVLDVISSILSKAIDWGYIKGENPARRVKKFRMKSRDRFLQPDEFPRFLEALQEEENDAARHYILMSLYTGARKSNVLAMRWDQIDFISEVWRIPETKNGEPLTLPLSKAAIELLNQIRITTRSEWVFPSDKTDGHLNDPKKAWKRILDRAGIENLRLHDLRRTLGSYQAATGANHYVIGKSLGHKSHASTAIYARLNIDPVRESVERATEAMFKFGEKA